MEQQLGILVDVRRMTDLQERLVVRQHPVDHVEVAARQYILVDSRDHLERDAFAEMGVVPPVVAVDVLGVLLLAFGDSSPGNRLTFRGDGLRRTPVLEGGAGAAILAEVRVDPHPLVDVGSADLARVAAQDGIVRTVLDTQPTRQAPGLVDLAGHRASSNGSSTGISSNRSSGYMKYFTAASVSSMVT
jgi:hypothetical protein